MSLTFTVGDLTIHGATREVVLLVDGPTAEQTDPWGNTRVGASASTKIKRSDFGITWNSLLETGGALVGDEISITLDVSLVRSLASCGIGAMPVIAGVIGEPTEARVTLASPPHQVIPAELIRAMIPLIADAYDVMVDWL